MAIKSSRPTEEEAAKIEKEMKSESPGFLDKMGSFFGLGGEKTPERPTGSASKNLKDSAGNNIIKDGKIVQDPNYSKEAAQWESIYGVPSQESLKAQMTGDLSKLKKGQSTASASVPGQAEYGTLTSEKPSEPWTAGRVFENLKREAGGVKDVVSKGASAAADFATKNKGLVGMGIEGAAAYGGYQAGKSAREAQTELAKQQLQESQRIGAELGKIQYPGQMYSAETANIQEAIAKGGMTPELARASELAKRSGMSIAAGGMKAATDLAARTGGKATAGSALLGSMLGAQMGGGKAADIEANIGVEASKNKIEQLRRLSDIESQKFKEESGLAQTKDVLAASRAGQTAGARGSLMDIESSAGTAKANLFGAGANLAQTALGNMDLGQVMRARTGEAAPQQTSAQAPAQQPAPTPQEVAKGQALKKTAQDGVKVGTPPPVQTKAQTSGANATAMNQNLSKQPAPMTPAATPSAASNVGNFLQGALSKGKEMMSQMPQAQQDQLKKTGISAVQSIAKGAGIKI